MRNYQVTLCLPRNWPKSRTLFNDIMLIGAIVTKKLKFRPTTDTIGNRDRQPRIRHRCGHIVTVAYIYINISIIDIYIKGLAL